MKPEKSPAQRQMSAAGMSKEFDLKSACIACRSLMIHALIVDDLKEIWENGCSGDGAVAHTDQYGLRRPRRCFC